MAGIFNIDQFIDLNFKPTPINLASNDDPSTVQRLEQAKQAGYNDRAAEHNETPEAFSGFQPQTLAEKSAYREGSSQYDSDVNADRSLGQSVNDTLLGLGAGFANSVGSMVGVAEAFHEGMLNPNSTIGETISRNLSGVQSLTNAITGMQSDELKARQRAQAMRSNIQEQVDQAQYEQDLANGMGSKEDNIG